MKNKKALIYFLLIAVISITLTTIFLTLNKNNVEYREIDIFITIGKVVGFNVNPSAIYFGTVPKGGISKRTIQLNTTEKSIIEIKTYGEASDWISVDKNKFILDGSTNITVIADVPVNSELGNYTGKLKIYFRKL
ncbi:MAG: hypothetical protein HYS32_03285 [Candidatus Woesearchaeota archaeon]|nr:MAG: hypothetical protein HYS32_03285 [Candidatus Woesearchaeota archaeon]